MIKFILDTIMGFLKHIAVIIICLAIWFFFFIWGIGYSVTNTSPSRWSKEYNFYEIALIVVIVLLDTMLFFILNRIWLRKHYYITGIVSSIIFASSIFVIFPIIRKALGI